MLFFKQKTAYEMRISDWSSDVCSADLLKERLGGDAAEAFRFLGSTEFRTLSEHDLAENLRARIAYWFKGDADTITARFRGWLEEEQNFNRPIGYDDVVSFARGARIETKQYELDRALPGRSEEHTSELQSLMRISYAVFCLKN